MLLWWALPLGSYLIVLLQNLFTGNLFYIDDSEKYVETSYISIYYIIVKHIVNKYTRFKKCF